MIAHRVFKQVPRILFGSGTLARLDELLPARDAGGSGVRVFLVDQVHKTTGIADRLPRGDQDLLYFVDTGEEPSTRLVDEMRDKVQADCPAEPDAIIGVGGGSSMDVAKAVSVMLRNPGSSSQYQGWDLVPAAGVFKVGIPTVSGSGSEASRTAVLMGPEKKFGINSDFSMFDAILLDSSLIKTVPADQRFHTAMDCYIHSVEAITGTMKNELSGGYATHALELCRHVMLQDGNDDELMTSSYMGGCSVVNSEVGVCHALSYGLSLVLKYRHGLANCIAFNVLDDYYGEYVAEFREMQKKHAIELPTGVARNLSDEDLERMVQMTLKMERPLTNALGTDWAKIFTADRIRELYQQM